MSSRSLVIAIDGPSGSGKSTVATTVALRLGLRYLDTGAMYRAVTWWLLAEGVDLHDVDRVASLGPGIPLQMSTDPADPHVFVDGVDITDAIRETRISESVSAVATNLRIREFLVADQKSIASEGNVVIEGRDITTVVAPDAPVRVLLTASESARLVRRARDVHGDDDEHALHATRDQILRRDDEDSTVANFREAATGVAVVDSSKLTLDETVQTVLTIVAERTGVRA